MSPVLIGIAGGSASGKTTVVRRLLDELGPDRAAAIAHDRYYRDRASLTPDARTVINYDHPDALDTDLFVQHLEVLRTGRPIDAPVYDFSRHARRPERERIHPRPAIIVEGILVLAEPRLRALMDLSVYVDAGDDARLARRLARDVADRGRTPESVLAQYASTVRPMHEVLVAPSRRYADMILAEGGFNETGVQELFRRVVDIMTGIKSVKDAEDMT
jgi:uridine kinase